MRELNVFFLVLLSAVCLRAELPPSAYEKMQKEAPDVLRLNILSADSTPATPDTADVTLVAEIVKVGRSSRKAKPGDLITIKYQLTARPKNWVGPGEVPVPETAKETVAFLKPIEGSSDYAPAAGAMSFSMF